MAERIQLVDDIDGSDATERVFFGLDGANYEIDLSAANAAKLREVLAAYIKNARKANGVKKAAKRVVRDSQTAEIRQWAADNGYEVSPRGRIPAEISDAYQKAMGK